MWEPILSGLIAAIFILIPASLQDWVFPVSWSMAVFIFGIGIWNAFFEYFLSQRNSAGEHYDGFADFLIYIHSPIHEVSGLRWLLRALNSLFFTICGGSVGPEGAAVEILQAIRVGFKVRSSRWFEQRRRTEVSLGLAGAIAAAFQAPLAGILLPIELGLGGRSFFAIISALTAFLGVKVVSSYFSVRLLNVQGVAAHFSFSSVKDLLGFVLLGILSALAGWGILRFLDWIRFGFLKIFASYRAIGCLIASGFLVMVYLIYPAGHQPGWMLLENILQAKHSLNQVSFLFVLELLSLSLVLTAFGTLGVFWPVVMLGGMLGFGFHTVFFGELNPFGAVTGLVGASTLFGVVFGAPWTGAVLVYELTHDFQILLPCLIAGLAAKRCCKIISLPSLQTLTLQARGHSLLEGRSSDILSELRVESAMVTDFQSVHETEPMSVIRAKILESRYPFLPVVNSKSQFVGLLTIDLIEEGWKKQTSPGSVSLSALLEAKDLLTRARKKPITLKQGDPLSMTHGLFDELPCVVVLTHEVKIVGLLFAHNVRQAYDRETTRRSLTIDQKIAF